MSKYYFSYGYLDGRKGWVGDEPILSVPAENELIMPDEFEERWDYVQAQLSALGAELHEALHAKHGSLIALEAIETTRHE